MSSPYVRGMDPEVRRIQQMKGDIMSMYKGVQQKMAVHDDATNDYKDRQQQYFLKVFTNVMEKLSEQLKMAQDRYRNIDLQIQKDERVIRLQKQVFYFRQQCVMLTDQIKKLEEKIRRMKEETNRISEEKLHQYQILLKKTKQKNALAKKIERISNEKRPTTAFGDIADDQHNEILRKLGRSINNITQKDLTGISKSIITRPTQAQTVRDRPYIQKNQLLDIWQQCVREVKGNNLAMKYLAKETKLKTFINFFSVQKIIDVIKRQIFKQKCCNNPQCKNNIVDPLINIDDGVKLTRSRSNKPRPINSADNPSIKIKDPISNRYRKFRQSQPLVIQNNMNFAITELQ